MTEATNTASIAGEADNLCSAAVGSGNEGCVNYVPNAPGNGSNYQDPKFCCCPTDL